ncbi:FAD-binding protein [Wenxinia saemankumensis]|uniref:Xylitol oxidase n=1 Tax=Wenxinia saemankumensis TaxID=1447782 RepID=A0A1M6ACA3_9RHOB|nr:FAD-binding protein [Wenxinia saemankumensis]SHI34116.1 xylitol oxidase [Wenxinia saemankumensis]
MGRTNWAGNLTYGAEALAAPRSVEEVQDLVRGTARLKALGSRHSFNGVADTSGTQVSLAAMDRVTGFDAATGRVTAGGGILHATLAEALQREGRALSNLASLPHISVVGAAATATHGSGSRIGGLAAQVAGLQIVDGTGRLREITRAGDSDLLDAIVVGIGALGIVTQVTLDTEPTYDIRQDVFEDLPFARLEAEFDAIMGAGHSVSVFTEWAGESARQVWVKSRTRGELAPRGPFHGARPARCDTNPVPGAPAVNATPQMGVPGPWHERLPHFRMGFAPSSGEEIQAEYFVAREDSAAMIAALRPLGHEMRDALVSSEIRTVAADEPWLSPAARGDRTCAHFTFRRDAAAVARLLPRIEDALAPLGAVPHWGKVTAMPPERIAALFPRLRDFREIVRDFDPEGKFANAFTRRLLEAAA